MVFCGCCGRRPQRVEDIANGKELLTLDVNAHMALEFRWEKLVEVQGKIGKWVQRRRMLQQEPHNSEWDELMVIVNESKLMLDPCRSAAYRIEEWMNRAKRKGRKGMLNFIHEALSAIKELAPHPRGLAPAWEYSKVVLAAAVLVSSVLHQCYHVREKIGYYQRFQETNANREYELIGHFKRDCERSIMDIIFVCKSSARLRSAQAPSSLLEQSLRAINVVLKGLPDPARTALFLVKLCGQVGRFVPSIRKKVESQKHCTRQLGATIADQLKRIEFEKVNVDLKDDEGIKMVLLRAQAQLFAVQIERRAALSEVPCRLLCAWTDFLGSLLLTNEPHLSPETQAWIVDGERAGPGQEGSRVSSKRLVGLRQLACLGGGGRSALVCKADDVFNANLLDESKSVAQIEAEHAACWKSMSEDRLLCYLWDQDRQLDQLQALRSDPLGWLKDQIAPILDQVDTQLTECADIAVHLVNANRQVDQADPAVQPSSLVRMLQLRIQQCHLAGTELAHATSCGCGGGDTDGDSQQQAQKELRKTRVSNASSVLLSSFSTAFRAMTGRALERLLSVETLLATSWVIVGRFDLGDAPQLDGGAEIEEIGPASPIAAAPPQPSAAVVSLRRSLEVVQLQIDELATENAHALAMMVRMMVRDEQRTLPGVDTFDVRVRGIVKTLVSAFGQLCCYKTECKLALLRRRDTGGDRAMARRGMGNEVVMAGFSAVFAASARLLCCYDFGKKYDFWTQGGSKVGAALVTEETNKPFHILKRCVDDFCEAVHYCAEEVVHDCSVLQNNIASLDDAGDAPKPNLSGGGAAPTTKDVGADLMKLLLNSTRISSCMELWADQTDTFTTWSRAQWSEQTEENHDARLTRRRRELKELANKVSEAATVQAVDALREQAEAMIAEVRRDDVDERFLRTRSGREVESRVQELMLALRTAEEEAARSRRRHVFARNMDMRRQARDVVEELKAQGWERSQAALKAKLTQLSGPTDAAGMLRLDAAQVRATVMAEKLTMDARKLKEDSSRVSGIHDAAAGWTISKWKEQFEEYKVDVAQFRVDVEHLRSGGRTKSWLELKPAVKEVVAAKWRKALMKLRMGGWDLEAALGEEGAGVDGGAAWAASVRVKLADFRADVEVIAAVQAVKCVRETMQALKDDVGVDAMGASSPSEGSEEILQHVQSIVSGLEIVKSGIFSNGSVGLHLQFDRISNAFARTATTAAARNEHAESDLAGALGELKDIWIAVDTLSRQSREEEEHTEELKLFVHRTSEELAFRLFERLKFQIIALCAAFDRAGAEHDPISTVASAGTTRQAAGEGASRSQSPGQVEHKPLGPAELLAEVNQMQKRISAFLGASSDLLFEGMQLDNASWVKAILPHLTRLQRSMEEYSERANEASRDAFPDLVEFLKLEDKLARSSALVDEGNVETVPPAWSELQPRYVKLKQRMKTLLSSVGENVTHEEGRVVLDEARSALAMQHSQGLLDLAQQLGSASLTEAELAPLMDQLKKCAELVQEIADSLRAECLDPSNAQRQLPRITSEATRAALREQQFRALRSDMAELALCSKRVDVDVEAWLHSKMIGEMRLFWSLLCCDSPLWESHFRRHDALAILADSPRLLHEDEHTGASALNPKFLKETKRIRGKLIKLSGESHREAKSYLDELAQLFYCNWSHCATVHGEMRRMSSEARRCRAADAKDAIEELLQQVYAGVSGGAAGMQESVDDSGIGAQYVLANLQRWSCERSELTADSAVLELVNEALLEDSRGERSDEGPEDRLLPHGDAVPVPTRVPSDGRSAEDHAEAQREAILRAAARREHREVREHAAFILQWCCRRRAEGGGGHEEVSRRCQELLEVRKRLERNPEVRKVLEGEAFVESFARMRGVQKATNLVAADHKPARTAAPLGVDSAWGNRLGKALDARWQALRKFESSCHNPFLATDLACEERHMREAQRSGWNGFTSLEAFIDNRLSDIGAKVQKLGADSVSAAPASTAMLDKQLGNLSRQVAQVALKVEEVTVTVKETASETNSAVLDAGESVKQRVSELEKKLAAVERQVLQSIGESAQSLEELGHDVKEVGRSVEQVSSSVERVNQGVERANQGVERVNQGVERVGQGVDALGSGVETVGRGLADLGRGVREVEEASKLRAESPAFAQAPPFVPVSDAAPAREVIEAMEARIEQMERSVMGAATKCEDAAKGVDRTIDQFNHDHLVIKEAGDAVRQSVDRIGGIVTRAEQAASALEDASKRTEETAGKAADKAEVMAAAAVKGQQAAEQAKKETQYMREAAAKAQEDCDVMRQAAKHTQEVVKAVRRGAERSERAAERAAQHATVLAQAALKGQEAATVAAKEAGAMSAAAEKGLRAAERAATQAERMGEAAMEGEKAVGCAAQAAEDARDKVTEAQEELRKGLLELEGRLAELDVERRAAHGEREQAEKLLQQAQLVVDKGIKMQQTQDQVAHFVREEMDRLRAETAAETATTTAQLMQHAIAKLTSSIEATFMSDGQDKLKVLEEDMQQVIVFNREWLRLVQESPYHWGHDKVSKIGVGGPRVIGIGC